MRPCLVATLSCYLLNSAIAGAAGEGRRQPDSPSVDRAWEFIETSCSWASPSSSGGTGHPQCLRSFVPALSQVCRPKATWLPRQRS